MNLTLPRSVLLIQAAASVLAFTAQASSAWMPTLLSPEVKKIHHLPDYSYAGYGWGEKELPDLEPTLHVTDFGAVPDDGKDDTEALKKAFAAALRMEGTVVLRFPKGKLLLSDILYIERSDFVLQGSGSGADGTIIYITRPLNKLPLPDELKELEEYVRGNNMIQREPERGFDVPFSLYAWSGGFLWTRVPGERAKPYLAKYDREEKILARVLSGKRGANQFDVEDASKLTVGRIVRLNWYNKEGKDSSLVRHLYDEQPVTIGQRHWETPSIPLIRQEVMIVAVDGKRVTIKEPLMHDLRPEWHPDISEWKYLRNVGIEHLRIEFMMDEYFVHHGEAGYNAIKMTNTTHSWVRDVACKNADSTFIGDVSSAVTLEDIEISGRKAHYGLYFGTCYHMLAKNVRVNLQAVHSLSLNTASRACVFTQCTITREPSLDQHSGANHQNLFDDILLYEDNPEHVIIYGGGAPYWAPTHGAFTTFWNIRINFLFPRPDNLPIRISDITQGPSARLIGMSGNYPIGLVYGPNAYMEGINQPEIAVPSLYQYQLKKRLESKR